MLTANEIRKKFESDKLIPEIVNDAPVIPIKVTYPNGKEVNFGEELTPTEVKDQPNVQWEADPAALYTLIMLDPDVRVEYKDIIHWLVVNVKGNDLSTGETVVPYVGSGAPKGTGLHRYTFLVFEQTNGPFKPEGLSSKSRPKFSTKNFVEKYGLGKLVAGNYFKAQWDEYVDELWKSVKQDK